MVAVKLGNALGALVSPELVSVEGASSAGAIGGGFERTRNEVLQHLQRGYGTGKIDGICRPTRHNFKGGEKAPGQDG